MLSRVQHDILVRRQDEAELARHQYSLMRDSKNDHKQRQVRNIMRAYAQNHTRPSVYGVNQAVVNKLQAK